MFLPQIELYADDSELYNFADSIKHCHLLEWHICALTLVHVIASKNTLWRIWAFNLSINSLEFQYELRAIRVPPSPYSLALVLIMCTIREVIWASEVKISVQRAATSTHTHPSCLHLTEWPEVTLVYLNLTLNVYMNMSDVK